MKPAHPSIQRGHHRAAFTLIELRVVIAIIAILAALLLPALSKVQAAGFPFFEPVQPPRRFQLMVHRGEASQAPENTRSALDRCIEDGLEWAEVDVRLTQDGQHILSHGATITDGTGKSWNISKEDWAALRELDVGSSFGTRFAGERLLSLGDCFALCKGKLNLYLDCKKTNPEQLGREIVEAGMERQVVVYANLSELREVEKASAGKIAGMTKWRPGVGGPEWAESNRLAAVEIDAPDLTPAIAASFHRGGIKVEAKVLNDWDRSAMWERVMAAGADWLQTDLPEEVLAEALWRRLPERPVLISLHRGANRYAPENTLPAFAKAIRMGVDYVEFDVRTTRDGQFFLLHDSRLDGTTDGNGPINEIAAETARKLNAGLKFGRPYADVLLPSLDDFMQAFSGKVGFYFDAKAIPADALAAALERYHMVDRTVVYQSAQFLAQLKAINPRIRGLAPFGKPEQLDELASTLKPYAVDANWDILSKDVIARCHVAGIRVFSDSIGRHERVEDYLRAIDWGIDLIQTDHPLRVFRALELWLDKQAAKPALPLRAKE